LYAPLQAASAEADAAQDALEEARSTVRSLQEETASLERALAEAQREAVAAGLRSSKGHELEVLVGQLQQELARGAAEVAEARRLKDTVS
jgi:hypothetical protein